MIEIRHGISFAIDKKRQSANSPLMPQNDGRVRGVVTWNGNRVRIVIDSAINSSAWEPLEQRFRSRTYHGDNKIPATTINRELKTFEDRVHYIFETFGYDERIPSKTEFLQAYDELVREEIASERESMEMDNSNNIFPIYDRFINDGIASGRWSKGTLVKVRTIRRHLEAISPQMTFDDLNTNGVNMLIQHFNEHVIMNRGNRHNREKGLANSTIKKDIEFVKTFVRWAIDNDYCSESKFVNQKAKLRSAKNPVIFLTWDELMRVYNFDFGSKNYLAQVRDVFCFCCFTSLRYSDVYNLRRANISGDAIRIITVKTNDTLVIELNKYSSAILEKYKGIPFPNDKALPVISNQRMNEYLKELGKICGIDTPVTKTVNKGVERIDKTYKKYELLGTHAGRRTFISNALMLGIPPDIVMKWTGHSDYKAMRPYIAIADHAKKEAMSAFNK